MCFGVLSELFFFLCLGVTNEKKCVFWRTEETLFLEFWRRAYRVNYILE